MPLRYQALLPFALLLLAAALASLPRLRPRPGLLPPAATALAGGATLAILLQLKPSERVDLIYLRTFPGADLAIRLDGVSLAFAVVLLLSASGLMLARLSARGDRRNPWRRWLLTAAASLWVVMAGNLVLLYIALQVLTLAWSGAIDESAPRVRTLRLVQQGGDLALLVAAGAALRSSGTSAFAGMPADAIDPLVLLLLVVPVGTRIAALVLTSPPPAGTIAFAPVVGWMVPAGALLFRMLGLAAGRPLDRPLQVAVFALALVVAAGLCVVAASTAEWPRFAVSMVAAQAAVLVALGVLQNSLATVGCALVTLQLIMLAGLVAIRPPAGSAARAIATLALGLIPPAAAFSGLWLALAGFSDVRLLFTGVPLAVVAGLASLAVARHISIPQAGWHWPADAWALVYCGLTFVPLPLMNGLVLPVARTVRTLPAGLRIDWFGFGLGFARWPVTIAGLAGLVIGLGLARLRAPLWTGWHIPSALPAIDRPSWRARVATVPWSTLSWVLYGVALAELVQR